MSFWVTFLILSFAHTMESVHYQPVILDFYKANYVFEASVIKKAYSSDSSYFYIDYNVSKHYKKSDNPSVVRCSYPTLGSKDIQTKLTIEEKYNTWMVYTMAKDKDTRVFRFYTIEHNPTYNNEKPILEKGNLFEITEYAFQNFFFEDFTQVKHPLPVTSILNEGKVKFYEDPYAMLALHIGADGKLLDIAYAGNFMDIDQFQLTKFNFRPLRQPTEFEVEAMRLVKKNYHTWQIKRHKTTHIPVQQIQFISLSYDNETNQWKYEG